MQKSGGNSVIGKGIGAAVPFMLNDLGLVDVRRVVSVLCVAAVFAVAMPALAAAAVHPASSSVKPEAAEAGASNPERPASWLFAKRYGDWLYRCEESPTPDGVSGECFIMQQIVATPKQGGQQMPLVTVIFSKQAGGSGHKVGAVVPVGIALQPGFMLWAGDKAPLKLSFDFCRADACVALPQPAARLESEFKTDKQAHAKFDLTSGQSVAVDISLDGFRAALTALDSGVLPSAMDQGEKLKKAGSRNK